LSLDSLSCRRPFPFLSSSGLTGRSSKRRRQSSGLKVRRIGGDYWMPACAGMTNE